MNKLKLAVFDLDGTLVDGQIWKALVSFLWERRLNRIPTASYVTRNMSRYALYKGGLMRREVVWDRFARELTRTLRGLEVQHLHPLADALYEERVAARIDPALLAEWERFGRTGYRRIILSGSPALLVNAIGRAMGADAVLGTEAEIREGRLTGGIVGDLVHGKAKMDRLLGYVAAQQWAVDWRHSHAFGDSHTDLMVLSLVGHPHAVRPDPRLHAHAAANGWRIWGVA